MNKIIDFFDFSKNKGLYILMAIISLIMSLLLIFIPLIQKNIIDNILNNNLILSNLLLFFLLGILLIIITLFESYLLILCELRIQKSISIKLLNSLSIIESFIIKTRGSGAFMNSVFGDSEQISMMLGNTNYFLAIGNAISAIVILFITSRWMIYYPIVIVFSYIFIFGILKIIEKKQILYFSKAREEIFKLNPKVLEFIENKRSIMNTSSFDKYLGEIESSIDYRDENFKKSMLMSNLGRSLIDSVKNISLIIIFIISMIMILNKNLTISNFIALTSYFPTVFLPLYAYKEIRDNKSRVEMLYDRNKESFEIEPSFVIPNNNEVLIDNVSLNYDKKSILSDFTLNIDRIYGIVGVSGEGKTSLLKLLTGDLIPQTGHVIYGDKDINQINLSLRYALFKIYYQENEIFDTNLKDNIIMQKNGLSSNEFYEKKDFYKEKFNEIKSLINQDNFNIENIDTKIFADIIDLNLLTKAQKEQLIIGMFKEMEPETINLLSDIKLNRNYYILEKYEELINDLNISYLEGRDLGQRGANISGGEKNKISLARLLLLETDLPYLIDEPFTNIDLISEKQSLHILKKYLKGKKGIIISHKLDLLNELSDDLVVISNGKIEAIGRHNHLLQKSDLYNNLYEEYLKRRIKDN